MIRYPLEYNKILNTTKYNTFGWVRKYKDGTPKFHKGWDLVAPMGTAVYPVSTGKVVGVQRNDVGKYGRTINLKFSHNGKTYYAFYSHLSEVYCSEGQEINDLNMIIGAVGDSGNAKGIAANKVHLHFEFRNRQLGGHGNDDRIDPAELLGSPPYHGVFAYAFEDELVTA